MKKSTITPADLLSPDLLSAIIIVIDGYTQPFIDNERDALAQHAAGQERDQLVQNIERMFNHEEQTIEERIIEASQTIEGLRNDIACLTEDAPECEPEFDGVGELLQDASEQLIAMFYDEASEEVNATIDRIKSGPYHSQAEMYLNMYASEADLKGREVEEEAINIIGRRGVKHTAHLMTEQLHTVQIHAIMNFLFINWNVSSSTIIDKAFADVANPFFIKHLQHKLAECNMDMIKFMGQLDGPNRTKIITCIMMKYSGVSVAEVKQVYQQIETFNPSDHK